MAVVWTGALAFSGARAIDDARGGTVDAEVVDITTNVPGRRWYDVRFTTLDGRVCLSRVDSGSNPPPREIRVGGTSEVSYAASSPCDSDLLRESGTKSPWGFVIFAAVAVVVCVFGAWGRLRAYAATRKGSDPVRRVP
ncbi:hypothetical protein ACQPZX_21775 [Actinoplanes sp. CA-142083]|uniref:hypothetical protein n=1 Tax=Actinoplanes sp. CA-142083 TaxID=3239903 RepID=UPI003D94F80F